MIPLTPSPEPLSVCSFAPCPVLAAKTWKLVLDNVQGSDCDPVKRSPLLCACR